MDIIETIIEILCQQGTVSQCQQAIQDYPGVTQQMFFLVFFPSVFLILFVYILAKGVTSEHQKMKVLVAVAIYIFIIFQGWYYTGITLVIHWYIIGKSKNLPM